MEDKSPCILHSECHGSWWPGDWRIQGISNHGIELAIREYCSIYTRRMKQQQQRRRRRRWQQRQQWQKHKNKTKIGKCCCVYYKSIQLCVPRLLTVRDCFQSTKCRMYSILNWSMSAHRVLEVTFIIKVPFHWKVLDYNNPILCPWHFSSNVL